MKSARDKTNIIAFHDIIIVYIKKYESYITSFGVIN